MLIQKTVIFLLSACVICAFIILGAGELLTRPATQRIGLPPSDFQAETVNINTESGGIVSGWFSLSSQNRGAILLLHGVRANRYQMLERAKALKQEGYSVLLIDLPAHGESTGKRITFGYQESKGVIAAYQFLRSKLPDRRIGIIGVSLGAASVVFANLSPSPDAIVLESMYPTITQATENRLIMRLGELGKYMTPLLLMQLPMRLGITAQDLEPIKHLGKIKSPVLVAAGTKDLHTKWAETLNIFAAIQSVKSLYPVIEAAHIDLFAFNPDRYKNQVFTFLHNHVAKDG